MNRTGTSGDPIFGAAGGQGFGAGNFAGMDNVMDQSVASGGDYALSSNWLTDFRVGWFRIHINEQGPDYNKPLGTELGIPGVNQGDLSLNGGLPQFNIDIPNNGSNGGANLLFGTSANQFLQTENQFQFVNNWTRYAGNHSIKFGADIRYAMNHLIGLNNNQVRSGNFGFRSSVTGGLNSSGLGWASFLLGNVSSFNRTQTANTDAQERQKRLFFYGQDQWHVSRNVTLSYGLRWELYYPESVTGKGQGGLLDLNAGTIRIAGYGPWGNNLDVAMEYQHFAPRVGITWQPLSNTVVRAGYGREYGIGWSGNTFGEVLTFSYPTQVNQNLNAPAPYYYSFLLQNGPPAYNFPPIPSSGNYPLPNGVSVPTRPLTMRIPTLDFWNLTIQEQLGPTSSLQIGYVGSHGIHNMFDSSNQADPNMPTIAGFDCVASGAPVGCTQPINPANGKPYTKNQRRPYYDGTAQQSLGLTFGHAFGWTQGLRYNANQATTSYQALQVVFEKRYSQGFQLMSHYTWSHALAHESVYYFIDPHADYGNSYYNRRQVFVADGNWDLPFGQKQLVGSGVPGWMNQIIGGFALNGALTWESGLPFTPSYSLCAQDEDVDGGTMCRPNWSGASFNLHAGSFDPIKHHVQYFTPVPTLKQAGQQEGAYIRPYPGHFGTIQRNALWGPGLINADMSVAKKFFLREGLDFRVIVQAFNAFNHPNLGQPSGCVDCGASSGLINDVIASQEGSSMRRLQFAARFDF